MNTTLRSLPAVLCAGLVLLAAIPRVFAQEPERLSAPIDVAIASDGRGAVIQRDGAVYEFDSSTGKRGNKLYVIPKAYLPSGIDVAPRSSKLAICLSLYLRSEAGFGAWFFQLTRDGQVWTWMPSSDAYGDCALDVQGNTGYIVGNSGEALSVPLLTKDVRPKFLADAGTSKRLGPIAFDPAQRLLVVADAITGTVFLIDVARKVSMILTELPGTYIRGLAIDGQRRRVYAVDAFRRAIWSIDLRPGGSKREQRLSKDFRDPSGIALDPSARLWVSDERGRHVSRIQGDGSIDMRIAW